MKTTIWLLGLASCALGAAAAEPFPVHIEIDAARPLDPLPPIWRFFGADETNSAVMPDGLRLLGE